MQNVWIKKILTGISQTHQPIEKLCHIYPIYKCLSVNIMSGRLMLVGGDQYNTFYKQRCAVCGWNLLEDSNPQRFQNLQCAERDKTRWGHGLTSDLQFSVCSTHFVRSYAVKSVLFFWIIVSIVIFFVKCLKLKRLNHKSSSWFAVITRHETLRTMDSVKWIVDW